MMVSYFKEVKIMEFRVKNSSKLFYLWILWKKLEIMVKYPNLEGVPSKYVYYWKYGIFSLLICGW